jgi:hypothetical protein
MMQQFDWSNNPHGLPPLDLGAGPDGQPRKEFTERDLQLLWANPITQVAIDAWVKGSLVTKQAISVGYQGGIHPTGLESSALNSAFLKLGTSVRDGEIRVSEDLKRRYAYIYEIESDEITQTRIRRLEDECQKELIPKWIEFSHKNQNAKKTLFELVEKFLDEEADVYLQKYPEAFPYLKWRFILVLLSAIWDTNSHSKEDVRAVRKHIDALFWDTPDADYRKIKGAIS